MFSLVNMIMTIIGTLDKSLFTISSLSSTDDNFESNYNNRKFVIDSYARVHRYFIDLWLSKTERVMSGSGFTFGSKTTKKSADIKKIADFCIVFDHRRSIGFDNNDSDKCTGYISNCLAFNNKINYQLPYKFSTWTNNWNWSWWPYSSHQFKQSQTLRRPEEINQIATTNYAIFDIRNKIISNCKANKFDDTANFDNAIKGLKIYSEFYK